MVLTFLGYLPFCEPAEIGKMSNRNALPLSTLAHISGKRDPPALVIGAAEYANASHKDADDNSVVQGNAHQHPHLWSYFKGCVSETPCTPIPCCNDHADPN